MRVPRFRQILFHFIVPNPRGVVKSLWKNAVEFRRDVRFDLTERLKLYIID
jgi:hypothetical protein